MICFTIPGEPIGKPRMTRRDKWKQRDCVVRYRSWADEARKAFGQHTKLVLAQPTIVTATAFFAIPESWSRYKREQATGRPHTVTPDGDNVMKALKDALFHNDQFVTDARIIKRYDDGRGPRLECTISTREDAHAHQPVSI